MYTSLNQTSFYTYPLFKRIHTFNPKYKNKKHKKKVSSVGGTYSPQKF